MLPTLFFRLSVSGGLSLNVELGSSAKPLTCKLQEPTCLLLSAGSTHAHQVIMGARGLNWQSHLSRPQFCFVCSFCVVFGGRAVLCCQTVFNPTI